MYTYGDKRDGHLSGQFVDLDNLAFRWSLVTISSGTFVATDL